MSKPILFYSKKNHNSISLWNKLSLNNQLDDVVLRDFQSAIVGNHETVRKYGITITEGKLNPNTLAYNSLREEKLKLELMRNKMLGGVLILVIFVLLVFK